MKIAIIAEGFPQSSLCLAKHIAELGVHVDYYRFTGLTEDGVSFAFDYSRVSKYFLYHKKVKSEEIPELSGYFEGLPFQMHLLHHSKIYKNIPFLYNFVYKKIIKMLLKEGYDAYNLVGGERMKVFHLHPLLPNIVHSLHEVGLHSEERYSTPLVEAIISDKTPVLFFSESTRSRFLKLKGAESCKTSAIPFGKFETIPLYDCNLKINTGLDLKKRTFMFFGYIRPFKGLDILAQAMRQLKLESDNYNVIVAGSGSDPFLDFFKNQPNCFVLNKMISNQELNALFKMADVILMPYKSASQTGIAPTAYLFGKPIIATKVGALPDVVIHEKNGLLIEPNNAGALSASMMRLINDSDLLYRLSEGTKSYGKDDAYDWHKIARDTLEFMDSIRS
jgi:Glycosyltransferase